MAKTAPIPEQMKPPITRVLKLISQHGQLSSLSSMAFSPTLTDIEQIGTPSQKVTGTMTVVSI
jgi:hypothetical protein